LFAHHNEDLLPPTLHRPAPDINTLGQAAYDERPVLSRLPRAGEANHPFILKLHPYSFACGIF
jgi:hypothetical protein